MGLKDYMISKKNVVIAAAIFSAVCFCYMLVNPGISIDEETWIQIERPFAMWLVQGRWGIDIFNFLSMDQWRYAPVLWDILALAVWNGAGIIFGYTLFGAKAKTAPLFFFQAYFCSLPFVVGEMFSFSMFSLQIAVGMLSVSAAFEYSVRAVKTKARRDWLYSFAFLVYAIAVYQAYICVYITAVCAYSFKRFLEKRDKILRDICSWAVLCLVGIGAYFIIHFILMKLVGTTSYLTDNYIGWFDEGGIPKAIFMAVANIVRVSLAIPVADESVYGGGVIRCVTVIFLLFTAGCIVKEKEMKRKAGYIFYASILIAAPFSLFLALGTYKTHGRVLLGLSLAGAFEIYLILSSIKQEKLRRAGIVVGAYILFINAKNMNMLFYSANVAYEHDRTTANQVMYDIKKLGYDYRSKPIVFIGMEERDEVGLPVSDTVGSSIFEWDDGNIMRMCNFIKTEGYAVAAPGPDEIQKALKYKSEMKAWPQGGSVMEQEGIIIVFFSEPTDKWYATNQAVMNDRMD